MGGALLAAMVMATLPLEAWAAPKAAQMVDLSPNHWAFPAIKNLVDKYKVMGGYPDLTFRGTQPVSRYEAAQMLSNLIEKLDRPTVDENKILDFDKETIDKLKSEFKKELASVSETNKRMNAVEGQLKELKQKVDGVSQVKGSVSTRFMDQLGNQYYPFLASDISLKFQGALSDNVKYETRIGGGLAASPTGNAPAIANNDSPPENTARFGNFKLTYANKDFNNAKFVVGYCGPEGFGLGGFAGHCWDGIIGSGLMGWGANTVNTGDNINFSGSMNLGALKVAAGLTSKSALGNIRLSNGPVDVRVQGDFDLFSISASGENPSNGIVDYKYNVAAGFNVGSDKMGLSLQAGLKQDIPRAAGAFVFNVNGIETAVGAKYSTDSKMATHQLHPGAYVYVPSFNGLPTLLVALNEPQTLSTSSGGSGSGSLMGDKAGITVQTYIDNPIIPNLTLEFNLQDKILTYDSSSTLIGYALSTSFDF